MKNSSKQVIWLNNVAITLVVFAIFALLHYKQPLNYIYWGGSFGLANVIHQCNDFRGYSIDRRARSLWFWWTLLVGSQAWVTFIVAMAHYLHYIK